MSNPSMKTVLAELRELIARQIEAEFKPLHVCERCGNLAEGALVERIVAAIRDED
jgi:hypothetical protein